MYFFIFTDMKTNRTAKFKCLSCEKGKKRNDVVIFMKEEYNFENEVIKSTFLKYGTILSDSLCCLCFKVGPKMPKQAVAREGRVFYECKNNGNEQNRIKSHWDHIWK